MQKDLIKLGYSSESNSGKRKREQSKLLPDKGVFGANAVVGNGKHKGYSYVTSQAVTDNIIAKKQTEYAPLFDMGDSSTVEAEIRGTLENNKGKRINLTPIQAKLVTALAMVVDTQLENETLNTYIDDLPKRFLPILRKKQNLPKSNNHTVIVSALELAKLIYGSKGGKQVDNIRRGLYELSSMIQNFEIKVPEGGKVTVRMPFVTFGKEVTYTAESGETIQNAFELILGDVFLYKIKTEYSLAPVTLLNLWNSTGNDTPLFSMLLFLLQHRRGVHIKDAHETAERTEGQLRKEKKTPGEIARLVDEAKTAKLTYSESITSILSRLADNYTQIKNGKQYIRKERLVKDLKRASEDLIKVGIIKQYYERQNAQGETICCFVFNENWLQGERAKIQATEQGDDVQEAEFLEIISPC